MTDKVVTNVFMKLFDPLFEYSPEALRKAAARLRVGDANPVDIDISEVVLRFANLTEFAILISQDDD